MSSSIEFNWNIEEFDQLYESCKYDDNVNLALKNIQNKEAKIIEIGCGSGRIVKYLSDKGYSNIEGIELNEGIVTKVKEKFPNLNIYAGDLLNYDFKKESYDFIFSLGVVEHFWNGLEEPLQVHYDVLKKGGIALITVPSYNLVRRLTTLKEKIKPYLKLKTNPFLRKLLNKKDLRVKPQKSKIGFYIYPQYGDFFEFRLTPKQFKKECKKVGFEIVNSVPISHIDGLYHSFGEDYVKFSDWKFTLTKKGELLNKFLKLIPFAHNHMHALILKK